MPLLYYSNQFSRVIMTGLDYETVQSSKTPVTGDLGDGHGVSVFDLAVYRRLGADDRLKYQQELDRIIDQQADMPLPQREKFKLGMREWLGSVDKISPNEDAHATPAAPDHPDARRFIMMDSDTLIAHALPRGSDLKLTEREQEIMRSRVFEHEKAHLLGYDEAGADYIAAAETLRKYGDEALKVLQVNADRRITDAISLSIDPNAPKQKGVELYSANIAAMRDYQTLRTLPVVRRDEIVTARAHEYDQQLHDNQQRKIEDNPELKIKRALGREPIPASTGGASNNGETENIGRRLQGVDPEAQGKNSRQLYDEALKANPSGLSADEQALLKAYTEALQRASSGDYRSPSPMPATVLKP